MSIRVRILMLGLLSLLGILSVLSGFVSSELREIADRKSVLAEIEMAEQFSELVHELQKERGLSAGFLGGDDAAESPLIAQRVLSDQRLAASGASVVGVSYALPELSAQRSAILSRNISPDQSFNYFSTVILDVLQGIETIGKKTGSRALQDRLFAHAHFLLAKDYVGQMRATLMEGLAARRFDNLAVARLGRLLGLQQFHKQAAVKHSPPELAAVIELAYSAEPMRKALEQVTMAISQPHRILAIQTTERWFAISTRAIDSLKDVETKTLGEIKRLTYEESANAAWRLAIAISGTSAFAALLIWLAVSSTGRILRAIDILLRGVQQVVTTQDFAHRLPVYSYDEMGSISHSFNELLGIAETLIHEKESKASIDPLTGAYNRYKFRELFERALQHEKRYQGGMAMVFLDVDHFKRINDRYGHGIGDIVLATMTKLIHSQTRTTDIVARWGGEEFVILVPQGGAAAAQTLSENIRRSVAEFDFPDVGKITVSLGISAYVDGDSLESLCHRADYALYHAKEKGRDRVCTRLGVAAVSDAS